MLLKDKTIVMTGCLQGIGRKAVEVFAAEGADVFACAYRRTDEFETFVGDVAARCGVGIWPIYFDMEDGESVRNAAKGIMQARRPIDGLVNIAGIALDALFPMTTEAQIDRTLRVNTVSQILFSQYMVKLMLRHGGGSVVFTSSVTALDGNEGQTAYGTSKAGLLGLVRTMARELGPKGIRVNAVAPGIIDTALTAAVPEDVTRCKLASTALRRIGRPEEVAAVMAFLASDMAAYITGQCIRIDGGMA